MRRLVDSGEAGAGEIVLLFAAGTDAEHYEEELRKVGLATYRSTGRGFGNVFPMADESCFSVGPYSATL